MLVRKYSLHILALLLFSASCKKGVKQKDDTIYSKHLQEHFKLTIISTPPPNDMKTMNLLLVNDGQDFTTLRIKEIADSLYKNKTIKPLLIVGINAGNRLNDYGVAGYPNYQNNGNKAEKYSEFINDELIPYIKKNAGTKSFESVSIAGCSLGGLSAFDIAWDNHEKIDKVGVFSGSFWYRDKDAKAFDYSDDKNRIMQAKLKSSRKKPHLKYWFYAGAKEENSDRDKDGIIDVIDDTKDIINIIQSKNICNPNDITYVQDDEGTHSQASWSKNFSAFILWAVGK